MFSHQFKQQADSSNHVLKCRHCSSTHLCSHGCSLLTRYQHSTATYRGSSTHSM